MSLSFNSGDEKIDITSNGKIATEFVNQSLIVNLCYSLTHQDTTIGCAVFKLVYKVTDADNKDSSLKSTTIDTFGLRSETSFETEFRPAFEIAKSYDGQSTAQLGGWNISETYSSETHGTTHIEDTTKFTKDVTYLLGAPATFQVSLKDYYNIITGDFINWSRRPYDFTGQNTKVYESTSDTEGSESQFGLIEALGHSAFIAINTSRTSINENFEGYYIGLNDNMFVTPSDDYIFDAITGIKVTTDSYITKNVNSKEPIGLIDNIDSTESDYDTIGNQRLTFKLNSNDQGSVSRVLSRNITSKDISSMEFDDTVSLGLFKLSKTTDTNDILKLSYSVREKYNWSFSKTRVKSAMDSTKPVSYFVNNIMESSNNVTIMVNPYISDKDFLTHDGTFHGKIRMFSDKLVNNLDYFENKYLCRKYTSVSTNSSNIPLITPIKLATSNLLSYKEMIKQAGVSPYILRTTLRQTVSENSKESYKTFAPINSLYPFGVYTTATTS